MCTGLLRQELCEQENGQRQSKAKCGLVCSSVRACASWRWPQFPFHRQERQRSRRNRTTGLGFLPSPVAGPISQPRPTGSGSREKCNKPASVRLLLRLRGITHTSHPGCGKGISRTRPPNHGPTAGRRRGAKWSRDVGELSCAED